MTLPSNSIRFRVREIVQEAPGVATFFLEPVDGSVINYEAGQFLTFIIQDHGHEVRRSYSLSSAPLVDGFLSVTVKRVENGAASRYWIDFVRVGDEVSALPPAGRFTLAEEEQAPGEVVLIGGGSGVVPLFSLLKEILAGHPSTRVVLLLANSSEKHIVFYKQLTEWQKRFSDRLKIIHVLSQASDEWAGLHGRLNNMRLEYLVKQNVTGEYSKARFFLCGPSGLMRTAAITLKFLGFEKEQIRKESFVIEKPLMPRVALSPQYITLRIKGEEHRVYVAETETILDASLAAGIAVPYSCRGGKCSSCAAICRAGKVHMSINEVLTDREIEQGWVLTCTTYADDDQVVIDVL